MKKIMQKSLMILLACCMMLLAVGCNTTIDTESISTAGITSETSSNVENFIDDDFFEGEEALGNDSDSGVSSRTSPIPAANVVGGKSWADVFKGMPSSLKGTTLTVYNWNAISEYTGGANAIKQFQKSTGINVKWVTENFDTYLSKLASMVASGSSPDLVRMRSPLPSGSMSVQPISVTGYDYSDDAWDKWIMNSYTANGNVYATSLNNTLVSSPDMIMYNKALISKYDLDDPYQLWKKGQWTYDNFIKLCKDYKSESGSDYAGSLYDYSQITSWFGVTGPVAFDGKTYTSTLSNSNFISATQKMADLRNKDRLIKAWDSDGFDQGKILLWIGSAVYTRRNNSYFNSLKNAGSIGVVPCPKIEGQSNYYQLYSEVEAYGIAKGAKNPQAAPYFLRYFLDGSNYDIDAYFCNKQAVEVYNYCTQQTNKCWTSLYQEQTQFYNGAKSTDEFNTALDSATGAQVLNVINSNASVVNERVNKYNKQLSELK